MSRALNLDVTQAHVMTTCAKHKAEISCIETLPSGQTRVVLKTADAAETVRRAYKSKVVDGAVTRTPLRLAGQP